ncbi:MAG: hypothetical protein ABR985_20080 [Methanotrichaceae archaeon]
MVFKKFYDIIYRCPKSVIELGCCPFERSERQIQPGEGYKYLSSDALLDRINPACVKLGLATVVDTELLDWREKTTKSGMIWQIVSVKVTVTIIDSDTGEMLQTGHRRRPGRRR